MTQLTPAVADGGLAAARDAGVIDDPTYARLTAFLAARSAAVPRPLPLRADAPAAARFDLTHVLWYAGALIVMSSMGIFTTEAFNLLGGFALTSIAVAYAVVAVLLARMLWRRGFTVPGGLMATIAVSMVPLAIYGIQDGFDLWRFAQGNPGHYRDFFPYVNGSWIYMEIGTVVAALVMLRFFPFPFILFVASVALWFMSMDIASYFFAAGSDDWGIRREVSRDFGLAMILVAWGLDLGRPRDGDYGFWLHLFGAAALWGGLSSSPSSSEVAAALYCLINVLFVLLSVYLDRRIYAVFGAAGIAFYLGHLAYKVFNDVLLFSFGLSAVGLAIIGLGLLYHRQRGVLARWFDRHLPPPLRALRPARAAGT